MQCRVGHPHRQPCSERLVADGIVVLQKRDEGSFGQRRRGFATRSAAAKRRGLALIGKAFSQGAAETDSRLCRVIRIKANVLAGYQYVQCMVEIVVPLRREAA